MERKKRKNILVTGGCGFIGWNFLRELFLSNEIEFERVINLDVKDYSAINPEHDSVYDERYVFVQGDIQYSSYKIIKQYDIDTIINFAAKTHVDNSIHESSYSFMNTNILGFYTLLEESKKYWDATKKDGLFIQISTDEIFGSVEHNNGESFTETSKIHPNNPYSASKASAEMIALSYYNTYNYPIIITNCSNNYGPGQHTEKLIPKTIKNCLENKNIPVYGDGKQCRDWLHVSDHCKGIIKTIKKGKIGQRYLFGTNKYVFNVDIVSEILSSVKEKINDCSSSIEFVKDRPGHDRVYRVDYNKSRCALDWEPTISLKEGLESTVDWYVNKLHVK